MRTLKVNGMTCGHCANAVTQAIRAIDPAAAVRVDLPNGRVDIESGLEQAALVQAIEAAGYPVDAAART
jgi:copper chaperone CopZ